MSHWQFFDRINAGQGQSDFQESGIDHLVVVSKRTTQLLRPCGHPLTWSYKSFCRAGSLGISPAPTPPTPRLKHNYTAPVLSTTRERDERMLKTHRVGDGKTFQFLLCILKLIEVPFASFFFHLNLTQHCSPVTRHNASHYTHGNTFTSDGVWNVSSRLHAAACRRKKHRIHCFRQ